MASWLTRRQLRPELMDDPAIEPEAHRNALRGLERLNRLGRAAGILWPLLRAELQAAPVRVLDVACGRGDVLKKLVQWGSGRIQAAGLDVSAEAVREATRTGPPRVEFRVQDVLNPAQPLPEADVVICSLFLHHLTEEEAVGLLRRMGEAAARRVIASDLERSVPNWLLVWAGARLVTRSPIVHHDSARSVEASWKSTELASIGHAAGLEEVSVRRAFPTRLLLTATPPARSGRTK